VIEESGVEFDAEGEEGEARIGAMSPLADLDPAEFRAFLDTVTPDQFAEGLEEEDEEA
jgi:hypothetical protein